MVLSRPEHGPSLIHQGQRNAPHGVAHGNICVMNEGRCLPSLFSRLPARPEGRALGGGVGYSGKSLTAVPHPLAG